MRKISKERYVATNVLMEFEDGSLSFCIPRRATLIDISDNLDRVGKWRTGKLLSIDVCFKASDDSGFGRCADHPSTLLRGNTAEKCEIGLVVHRWL